MVVVIYYYIGYKYKATTWYLNEFIGNGSNLGSTVCMYVCMYGHHIQQSMDQPGKVANPARGQLNRENNIPLSPCVPENLVSRDGFSRPVPRQPAHPHTQAESGAYLRDSSRVPRRRPFMTPPYAIGSVPSLSGHAIAYRWRSLNLKVVPNGCCLGKSPWTEKYSPLFPTPTIGMKWAC